MEFMKIMGLTCSKTSSERFQHLTNIVKQTPCLTVYAAHGLLPVKNSLPIFIFSESHEYNESQQEDGNKNCLKVVDALKQVYSEKCTGNNQVLFFYEAATVSDNPYFPTRDIDDSENLDNFEGDDSIMGSRLCVKRKLKDEHHVKSIPYDVFGRIRG